MGNTQEQPVKTNGAFIALGVFGALGIIAGAVIAIISTSTISHQKMVDDYSVALGMSANDAAVAQAQLGVYVGWGLIILGVILLIAMLVIRAAKSK